MQSLALGEEGLGLSLGIFDIFEDLESLIAMLQGFLHLAFGNKSPAQSAQGLSLKFPVFHAARKVQRLCAIINGFVDLF